MTTHVLSLSQLLAHIERHQLLLEDLALNHRPAARSSKKHPLGREAARGCSRVLSLELGAPYGRRNLLRSAVPARR